MSWRDDSALPICHVDRLASELDAIANRATTGMPIEPMFAATRHGSGSVSWASFLAHWIASGAIKIDDDGATKALSTIPVDAKVRSGRVFFRPTDPGVWYGVVCQPFSMVASCPVRFGLRGT